MAKNRTRKHRPKRRPRARSRRPKREIQGWEIGAVSLLLWVLVGIAAVFGLQPWMAIGQIAVDHIEVIPFYGVLSKVPIVNSVFFWLEDIANNTAVSVVGAALCMTINITQVVGGTKVSTLQWVIRGLGGLMELCVAVYYHAPYDGGIEAMVADFPYLDPYYINVHGAIMTFISVLLFEILFLYGSEYIRQMRSEYQKQEGRRARGQDGEPQQA